MVEPRLAVSPIDSAAATPQPRIVLCIDDSQTNLLMLAWMLKRLPNIDVRSASSGSDGIALALASPPDLILLDINMPGMSGWEVLAVLKADARGAGIPVVALTAEAEAGVEARAHDAGFADYLTKPFRLEQLYATVARYLDDPRP